jgi:hypothetical protein
MTHELLKQGSSGVLAATEHAEADVDFCRSASYPMFDQRQALRQSPNVIQTKGRVQECETDDGAVPGQARRRAWHRDGGDCFAKAVDTVQSFFPPVDDLSVASATAAGRPSFSAGVLVLAYGNNIW